MTPETSTGFQRRISESFANTKPSTIGKAVAGIQQGRGNMKRHESNNPNRRLQTLQGHEAPALIAYYRVSTDRQGASGLGLDAQRAAVAQHIGAGHQLAAEYVEVESGKNHTNRPQLLAALQDCRRRRATLVIAKLDRLGRNVAFISALMDSGAEFVCCDNPHANRLMLHMLAAFAEHEREQISQRTKAALAQAKARGVKLGNPRPLAALELANAVHRARRPAPEVLNLIRSLRGQGMNYRAIASELNRLNIRTGRGCQWYDVTVKAQLGNTPTDQSPGARVRSTASGPTAEPQAWF
jgi:DNA invertase Pin-like site-specific DNA recombinase